MSNVSNGSVTPLPEISEKPRRSRRVRLAKAMVATGKAREVQAEPAAAQVPRARSRKLSHADELQLDQLKSRLASQGIRVRKGELLGAALRVLAALDNVGLREAVAGLGDTAPVRPGLAS